MIVDLAGEVAAHVGPGGQREDGDLRALLVPAVRCLHDGGLVAFPTETVYGLGADALDAGAVGRIFAAKGRPADNPLIVHVSPSFDLRRLAAEVPPLADALIAAFWPGPLTLVLPASPALPAATTAGLDSVGVRSPDHPVAQALLEASGLALAAPSANRSGRPSPTTAGHVLDDLGEAVGVLIDAGPCRVGIESTVVDVRDGRTITILRPGVIGAEQLSVHAPVEIATTDGASVRSPGMRHAHYQPRCRVELAPPGSGVARAVAVAAEAGAQQVGVVTRGPAPAGHTSDGPLGEVVLLGNAPTSTSLGEQLYALLRDADARGLDVLVLERPDDDEVGRAVLERMQRAAGLR